MTGVKEALAGGDSLAWFTLAILLFKGEPGLHAGPASPDCCRAGRGLRGSCQAGVREQGVSWQAQLRPLLAVSHPLPPLAARVLSACCSHAWGGRGCCSAVEAWAGLCSLRAELLASLGRAQPRPFAGCVHVWSCPPACTRSPPASASLRSCGNWGPAAGSGRWKKVSCGLRCRHGRICPSPDRAALLPPSLALFSRGIRFLSK